MKQSAAATGSHDITKTQDHAAPAHAVYHRECSHGVLGTFEDA